MTARTRVLLVDDHAILRAGLAMLVSAQPDLEVVAEASDGVEALAQVRRTRPDVVILDLTMPRMNGFEALRKILDEFPETKVLVLTMHDDPAYGRSLFAAGALGYVTKKAADRELLAAIRAVREGCISCTAQLRTYCQMPRVPASAELLSPLERQVLGCLRVAPTRIADVEPEHQTVRDLCRASQQARLRRLPSWFVSSRPNWIVKLNVRHVFRSHHCAATSLVFPTPDCRNTHSLWHT